jgi:toxin YoeB
MARLRFKLAAHIMAINKPYQLITFTEREFDEYVERRLKEIQRTPFTGTGKPEPLKHGLSGYWSHRIAEEHRLIYKIEGDAVVVVSCKGHYED